MRPLLLCGLLLFAACQETAPTLVAPPSLLVGPTWKLAASFDTYDGVWVSYETTRTEFILQFFADGRFVENIVGGCCRHEGTYRYDTAADSLYRHYTDGSNRDDALLVRVLTPERLELQRLGRHGPVIFRYRPR